jgi:F-type H+-transporting ATPase subunit a
LNLTFAMALVSVVVTQVFGFIYLGAGQQLGRYFQFKALFKHGPMQGPIEFFVGLIELVTYVARLLSFAFRLFGNIFAGSAVLALFAFLIPGLADVIFIPLEIFVAFVQALIFALLTLVFLQIETTSHEETESEHEAQEEFKTNEEVAATGR